ALRDVHRLRQAVDLRPFRREAADRRLIRAQLQVDGRAGRYPGQLPRLAVDRDGLVVRHGEGPPGRTVLRLVAEGDGVVRGIDRLQDAPQPPPFGLDAAGRPRIHELAQVDAGPSRQRGQLAALAVDVDVGVLRHVEGGL